MGTLRVNRIIPNTVDKVVIQGNLDIAGDIKGNFIGNINGVPVTTVFSGISASTSVVITPQTITENIDIKPDSNALLIGPEIRVNSTIKVGQGSNLYIYDPDPPLPVSTPPLVTATMAYALSWQKSASNFEFAFNNFRWSRVGNPTIGNKPFSWDINPRTNNSYIVDFRNAIRLIVAGCRIAWMDEETQKYFDWKFTYTNPFTLQPQVWEPKGMILTNTAGIPAWNNSINYAVGNKVAYNNFIWKCNIANSNQIPTTTIPRPFPNTDYWLFTGIRVNSGYGISLVIPNEYQNFEFNVSELPSAAGQTNFYLNGSVVAGVNHWGYGLSSEFSPFTQGKMPIITINTICNTALQGTGVWFGRYPTPFTVQHQMDMLDYINTGMGLNPNTLPKVDMINLGSNDYFRQGCDLFTTVFGGPTITHLNYANGYQYGQSMVDYVTQIRSNSEPTTANAKIMIQGTNRITIGSDYHKNWMYDPFNPNNKNQGFIHGFYNSQSAVTNVVDFDIISLQSSINQETGNLFYSAANNQSVNSWAWFMGGTQYLTSKLTIDQCKQALSLYGKQNRIKYWYRYLSHTIGAGPGYTLNDSNYSWATQTGVFMSMILTATDPDFEGFQYNSLIDYTDCVVNLLYNSTDTFGPNTTDVMDLTSVGWMFRRFLPYFKPDNGALSYTRLLKVGGALSTLNGLTPLDYCLGVYINSTGANNTPKHTFIICNYGLRNNQNIDIDASQLLDPTWPISAITYQKIYTTQSIYQPINYYSGGIYYTPQETQQYNPTPAQILSTPLFPTEYLIITAE